MSKLDNATMHAQHNHWSLEHAQWLEEIDSWLDDHAGTTVELQSIIKMLEEHQSELEHHRKTLLTHESLLSDQEYEMKRHPEGPSEEAISAHTQSGIKHETQRVAHEALKRRHREVSAKIANLTKAQ